tara:strand:- start:10630 stop:10884 length:255 start_codon:yes stop_codon:yes gene_type:complete
MDTLRSWAVIAGLVIVLGLLGAILEDDSPLKILSLGDVTSIFTWVTAVAIGMQIIAVVVMLIRGTYLRKQDRKQLGSAYRRRRT